MSYFAVVSDIGTHDDISPVMPMPEYETPRSYKWYALPYTVEECDAHAEYVSLVAHHDWADGSSTYGLAAFGTNLSVVMAPGNPANGQVPKCPSRGPPSWACTTIHVIDLSAPTI